MELNYFLLSIVAEVVARVQALRLNQNPKDDQIIREKVADTARLGKSCFLFQVSSPPKYLGAVHI